MDHKHGSKQYKITSSTSNVQMQMFYEEICFDSLLSEDFLKHHKQVVAL